MDEQKVMERVWEMWTGHRRAEIPTYLEGEGDSTQVCKRYLGLQAELYWEKKSLEASLAVTGFARDFAERSAEKEAVNILLYNTASFTLPWWSDSLDTTPWQRRRGLSAARQLLPLRRELGKGPADFSKASWVLGAHHLYRGDGREAVLHFGEALTTAREAGDKNLEACALEGLGRTRVRLIPRERDWGFESLGEARALYAEAGDEFNLGELEKFLGEPPA